MFHVLKHEGIDSRIVGRYDKEFEYDDEILGLIYDRIKDCVCYKKIGNKKLRCDSMQTKFENRLYWPYFISTREKPEFEIYRFKK